MHIDATFCMVSYHSLSYRIKNGKDKNEGHHNKHLDMEVCVTGIAETLFQFPASTE